MKTAVWLLSAMLATGVAAWAGEDESSDSGDHGSAYFEKLDTNHDGSLSKDEFSACCKNSHKQCKSKDGKSADHHGDENSSADDDKK